MQDMRLFLELAVKGQGGFKSAMNGMANTTSQATRKMTAAWGSVENRMSSVSSSMTKIAALLGGGALLRQAVVDVMNFERGLTEMRLTGELTAKEMDNIRSQIIALSSETLQLPEDQLRAFKDMVAAGIDPRQVLGGLKSINRAATATFADVGDMGKTAVDLFQKMNIKPEKLERAFNIMHKAGKSGRFELKDMSQHFPEVLAAASQYGITGERGIAQVSAMLQIARRNRGQPAEAATDMKAFFGHMISYRKEFKKVGLNVFDYVDLKSGKFRAGKDIDKFFEDLKKKSKGGSAAMLKAMGIQDYEASNFMAGLMRDWEDYKKIRDEALGAADQDVVGGDFDKVKETTWAKAKRLEIERSKAMKSAGSSSFAEKVMGVGNWAIENPITAGAAGLGTYAGWKLLPRFVGSGKAGSMGGGFPSGGVPVTVTNMPSGFNSTGGLFGNPTVASKTPLLATSVAAIPAVVTGALGYASIKTGEYLARSEASWRSNKDLMEIRARHMVMGGGPDSFQVKAIDDELRRRGLDVKNEINLTVTIDKDGRVFSRSDDLRTNIKTFQRGSFSDIMMPSP